MIVKKYLIGARKLDFVTNDGNNIKGTQLFVTDTDVKNNDGRIPEKIFISDIDVFDSISKPLFKAERDTLIPIELTVTLNGSKVKYLSAKAL